MPTSSSYPSCTVPLQDVVGKTRTVPVDFDVVRTAWAIDIGFGD